MSKNGVRPLRNHRHIGRFMVDSNPVMWAFVEGLLTSVVFRYFAMFGRGARTPVIHSLNELGAMVFGICFALLGLGLGLFEKENRFSRLASLRLNALAGALAAGLGILVLYLLTFQTMGRISLLSGSIAAIFVDYVLVHYVGSYVLRFHPRRFVFGGGQSEIGPQIIDAIRIRGIRHHEYAAELQPAVDAGGGDLDHCNALIAQLREGGVSELVVSWKSRNDAASSNLLFASLRQGIRVVEDFEYYSELIRRYPVESMPEAITLRLGFDVQKPVENAVKRFLDFVFACLFLILFSPVAMLIALAIKLDAPSAPILFVQRRTGRYGKWFALLKFRTMEANLEYSDSVPGDPRITSVGYVLRKTHLDELPQLVNILLGDMSFVGPRPEIDHVVEKTVHATPLYSLRHIVRPGLTGLAQIAMGKTTIEASELERKLSYDLFYIRNFNLVMDTWIVTRTAFLLFKKSW